MKFVLFSDLHLDTAFAWANADPALPRRRRRALRDTLSRIIELTVAERADALLCAGDLYEQERYTSETANFLRTSFEVLHPIPVYLAPGNHDWYGPASIYRQVEWSPNVTVFDEDQLSPVTLADGLTLWGAAHRAPANTDGFLDRFKVDRGGVHLALFHGSERGLLEIQERGKAPHAPFAARQIEEVGLAHAFVGHFHRPRDAANYTYPGNPDPLTFGEDGERGAVIVQVDDRGNVTRERRAVAVTRVHDLEVDVTGSVSEQDVRQRIVDSTSGLTGVARVTLKGDLDPAVTLRTRELADAAPWMDGLLVRLGAVLPAYDLDAVAAEQTVRGRFVREVRASNLDDETRRLVLLTGLRAFDGRSDLDVS
ncbi:MAG: metallophosphoesterase [Chloroflexota bacterium]